MSALGRLLEQHQRNCIICIDEIECHFANECRAELLQLRAAAEREALQAAVNEARELLTTLDWNDWSDKVDDWLAAHAPAPQEQP